MSRGFKLHRKMTDAEVLAEMGGERLWLCRLDQRMTNMKWCGHHASGCGWVWIVKEAAEVLTPHIRISRRAGNE